MSWQVFGRYVLNDTPTWAESLTLVLILYVALIGAAVGVRDAGHIGMESLLVLVSDDVRRVLEIVIFVLVGAYLYGFHHDGTEIVDGDLNPGTQGVIKHGPTAYSYGTPALADLNGDGRPEVIAGMRDGKPVAITVQVPICFALSQEQVDCPSPEGALDGIYRMPPEVKPNG